MVSVCRQPMKLLFSLFERTNPTSGKQALGKLAFLTLCDLALNPPFLGGKMFELGKFCFIKTKFEPNLSCFSK